MDLILKMLFVLAIAVAALVVWAIVYKTLTGKPFIVIDNGEPKFWKENPDDVIEDIVTLESLQGLWRMASVGRNGNFAPPDVIEQANLSIAVVADTFTITNTLELSTVEINNDVVPNQLDQTSADGDVHLCILRWRNGKLEICQAESGKPRPSDFTHVRTDGASLTLFEKLIDSNQLDSPVR